MYRILGKFYKPSLHTEEKPPISNTLSLASRHKKNSVPPSGPEQKLLKSPTVNSPTINKKSKPIYFLRRREEEVSRCQNKASCRGPPRLWKDKIKGSTRIRSHMSQIKGRITSLTQHLWKKSLWLMRLLCPGNTQRKRSPGEARRQKWWRYCPQRHQFFLFITCHVQYDLHQQDWRFLIKSMSNSKYVMKMAASWKAESNPKFGTAKVELILLWCLVLFSVFYYKWNDKRNYRCRYQRNDKLNKEQGLFLDPILKIDAGTYLASRDFGSNERRHQTPPT